MGIMMAKLAFCWLLVFFWKKYIVLRVLNFVQIKDKAMLLLFAYIVN